VGKGMKKASEEREVAASMEKDAQTMAALRDEQPQPKASQGRARLKRPPGGQDT
jgi:hypothetical protein